MVTMSGVWDRAMEVVRGRAGQLASIAAATLFLPGLVRDALPLVATPGSTVFAVVGGVVAIGAVLIALWGQLALLATATDPATTRSDASRLATGRFPATLAVAIVAMLAITVLFVPLVGAIVASGADLSSIGSTGTMPDVGGGTVTFILLYIVVIVVVGLVAGGRLILTNAVVLYERRGLGAFRRSWQLTRGLTGRITGVILLYLVVLGVAVSAAQFVGGAVFGLVLGSTALVAVLAAAIGGVVTTIFSVIATAFTAQLYGAVTDRGVAQVFE